MSAARIVLLAAAAGALFGCAAPSPIPALPPPFSVERPPPDAAAPIEAAAPPAPPTAAPPSPATTPPARLAWVNPARCLSPCDYAPPELVRIDDAGAISATGAHRVDATILEPTQALLAAAQAAGHRLRVASGFRPYAEQAKVFRTTKEKGRAARPGHSEHQLGTALDLRLPTKAALDWLADHAPDFGFALSYLAGKQRITGYRPEPWHVRFVGRTAADQIRRNGWTVEEYFRDDPTRGDSGSCADCAKPASRAPCARVTPAGACRGTVLTWCYDGALASVDCATSQQTCGPTPAGEPGCLGSAASDPPATESPPPAADSPAR